MLWLFRALADRLKAMLMADVAQDFEAQLLAHDAERKAELLRQAARYEDEGLTAIAQNLRKQAEKMTLERPLASVLPAVEHLESRPLSHSSALLLPFDPDTPSSPVSSRQARLSTPKKKGK